MHTSENNRADLECLPQLQLQKQDIFAYFGSQVQSNVEKNVSFRSQKYTEVQTTV